MNSKRQPKKKRVLKARNKRAREARTFEYRLVLAFRGLPAESGRCVLCGCTDDAPCFGGCAWVDDRALLCSSCFEKVALPERVANLFVLGPRPLAALRPKGRLVSRLKGLGSPRERKVQKAYKPPRHLRAHKRHPA